MVTDNFGQIKVVQYATRYFDQNLGKGDGFSISLGHTDGMEGEVDQIVLNIPMEMQIITLKMVMFQSMDLGNGGSDFNANQGWAANT